MRKVSILMLCIVLSQVLFFSLPFSVLASPDAPVLATYEVHEHWMANDNTVDAPSGINEGDLLILTISIDGWVDATPPAGGGFLTLQSHYHGGGSVSIESWYKFANNSEASTYTVTWGGAAKYSALSCVRITGADSENFPNANALGTATSGDPVFPAVTTTANDTLLYRVYAMDDNDDTTPIDGTPASHTRVFGLGGSYDITIALCWRNWALAGDTGTATWDQDASSEEWHALTVAISSPDSPPAGGGEGETVDDQLWVEPCEHDPDVAPSPWITAGEGQWWLNSSSYVQGANSAGLDAVSSMYTNVTDNPMPLMLNTTHNETYGFSFWLNMPLEANQANWNSIRLVIDDNETEGGGVNYWGSSIIGVSFDPENSTHYQWSRFVYVHYDEGVRYQWGLSSHDAWYLPVNQWTNFTIQFVQSYGGTNVTWYYNGTQAEYGANMTQNVYWYWMLPDTTSYVNVMCYDNEDEYLVDWFLLLGLGEEEEEYERTWIDLAFQWWMLPVLGGMGFIMIILSPWWAVRQLKGSGKKNWSHIMTWLFILVFLGIAFVLLWLLSGVPI